MREYNIQWNALNYQKVQSGLKCIFLACSGVPFSAQMIYLMHLGTKMIQNKQSENNTCLKNTKFIIANESECWTLPNIKYQWPNGKPRNKQAWCLEDNNYILMKYIPHKIFEEKKFWKLIKFTKAVTCCFIKKTWLSQHWLPKFAVKIRDIWIQSHLWSHFATSTNISFQQQAHICFEILYCPNIFSGFDKFVHIVITQRESWASK